MEVILIKDMPGLGHKDDMMNVKDGYGRNYLIPQGIAVPATSSAKKILAENIKQRAHKEERIKNEARDIAGKLENKKFTIGAKTSNTGKIFGSVNTIQIAEAIAKKGFEVDRKSITIKDEPIKEVGTYTAVIKLHKEVTVEIQFEVVSE